MANPRSYRYEYRPVVAVNDIDKLRLEIISSSISKIPTAISSNDWGREVFIYFRARLTSVDEALLHSIVIKSLVMEKEHYLSPFTNDWS